MAKAVALGQRLIIAPTACIIEYLTSIFSLNLKFNFHQSHNSCPITDT